MVSYLHKLIVGIIRLLFGFSTLGGNVCIYKTIMVNLCGLGLKGVIHLPIYVYGNVKIYKIGKIVFNCKLGRGIFKIGNLGMNAQGCTKFINQGVIEVNNPVDILGGTIFDNKGVVKFMGYNRIADGCLVIIRKGLTMGEHSRIGFLSSVMDTDIHFTVEVETGIVKNNKKSIEIGRYNYIGNTTHIKKGVKTPDYLIVASPNAMLNKDYTDKFPQFAVVGGSPVRLLKTGLRRVFNQQHEMELIRYFSNNRDEHDYEVLITGGQLEDYCKN